MGRRIFEERNFSVAGKVLSLENFKLFTDMPEGFNINKGYYPIIIEAAEKRLGEEIPQLYATEYMMFKRNGNRTVYEASYFKRRYMALELALAEYVEGKGRFLDKLIDTVWLMLEETTWVLPAHNPNKDGVNTSLPYAYAGHVDYIDLFSASTAATLALVHYLLKDKLDEATTLIGERILYELNRRIIEPYLTDEDLYNRMWWSGYAGRKVNNWCPWVVSNVLTVAALIPMDQTKKTVIVKRSLPILDAFISEYHTDGGCDEGPTYWKVAGGALYNALTVLYDLTAGYINIFDDPLIKNMGEYAVKAVLSEERVLNFADSPAKTNPSPMLLYHWGRSVNSEMMVSFAESRIGGTLPDFGLDARLPYTAPNMPYRSLRFLCTAEIKKSEYVAPKKFWLDGIIVAGTRESTDATKGLYLAMKGGHNDESHNHNDVGNIIVFADGKPIFIDAGCGTYTARTFNEDRYTIWSMRSEYHNCPSFNGIGQAAGRKYCSSDEVYDGESGRLTLSLKNAYPKECGLKDYHRSSVLENGKITVEDSIEFESRGTVTFNYLVNTVPSEAGKDYFILNGRKISFDSSLEYNIEELDKTEPEVEVIPQNWDTDVMRRITLTAKEPIKSKKYVMTIE